MKTQKINFPKSKGKTYEDILELAKETLDSVGGPEQWQEYYFKIGLIEIFCNRPKTGLEIGIKGANGSYQARFSAELAFHCFARGNKTEGKLLLKHAIEGVDKMPENQLIENYQYVHFFLAICYYYQGDLDNMTKHIKNLKEKDYHYKWYLLTLWLLTDQEKKAFSKINDWKEDFVLGIDSRLLDYLASYTTFDQFITTVNIFLKAGIVDDKKLLPHFIQKINVDACYHRIEDALALFEDYHHDTICFKVINSINYQNTTIKHSDLNTYFELLNINRLLQLSNHTKRHITSTVKKRVSSIIFNDVIECSYGDDDEMKNLRSFGGLVESSGLWEQFKEKTNMLKPYNEVAFLCGILYFTNSDDIREWIIDYVKPKICEVDEDYQCLLWSFLAADSVNSPKHLIILKEAIAEVSRIDKYYQSYLIGYLAKNKAIASSYSAWKKVKKSNRLKESNALFKACIDTENYDGLFDLIHLTPLSINERAQKALFALDVANTNNQNA